MVSDFNTLHALARAELKNDLQEMEDRVTLSAAAKHIDNFSRFHGIEEPKQEKTPFGSEEAFRGQMQHLVQSNEKIQADLGNAVVNDINESRDLTKSEEILVDRLLDAVQEAGEIRFLKAEAQRLEAARSAQQQRGK